MSDRLQVGELYHAVINEVSTMIVVTAVLPPCRQGEVGDERYRVRNLQGLSDEIEIRATAITGRCKFAERQDRLSDPDPRDFVLVVNIHFLGSHTRRKSEERRQVPPTADPQLRDRDEVHRCSPSMPIVSRIKS